MVEPISTTAAIVSKEVAKEAVKETAKEATKEALRETAKKQLLKNSELFRKIKSHAHELRRTEERTLKKSLEENSLSNDKVKNFAEDIRDGGPADKERVIKLLRKNEPNLHGELGKDYLRHHIKNFTSIVENEPIYKSTRGDLRVIMKNDMKLPVIDWSNPLQTKNEIFRSGQRIGFEVKNGSPEYIRQQFCKEGHGIGQILDSIHANDRTIIAVPKDSFSSEKMQDVLSNIKETGAFVSPILPKKEAAIQYVIEYVFSLFA
jgi:hypothetical protein